MTRPAPDWFGPDDPEMQREFLVEIAGDEAVLALGRLDATLGRLAARIPIRPSFTTGEMFPKYTGIYPLAPGFKPGEFRPDGSSITEDRIARQRRAIKRRPGIEP